MGINKTAISGFPTNVITNPQDLLKLLITLILITLPLENIFVSIATIGFVLIGIVLNKRQKINYEKSVFMPFLFFIVMALSLFWTNNFNDSLSGLQKSLSFIVIPAVFIIIPKISEESKNNIFRFYSFGMLFYAVMYFANACLNYYHSQ
ncbi:MAG: hypothetical protein RL108_1281, partial [Bacteroidota bacterium]